MVIRNVVDGALVAVLLVMWVRENRLRAYLMRLSTYLEAHMAKALADRTHMVRIPAAHLAAVLGSKVRHLPDPRQFNRKSGGRHPATERKVRKP